MKAIIIMTALFASGVAHAAPALKKDPAAAARADIKKTLGFVPTFMQQSSPHLLPGAWEEMKGLTLNPNTALSGKVKELIALAVASQIPCQYCTLSHTEFAKFAGATDEELAEAIGVAALTRHWSTIFNGMQIDMVAFQKELAKLVENSKKGGEPKAPLEVTDAKSARADIERAFGFVPSFMTKVPESVLPGAWRELRDLELANTAIGAKEKSLIGLAVAAQVPCSYCVQADTAFAKLSGATEQEIQEAVAVAAFVRHWSTILNGQQADKELFRREIRRILANVRAKQS